MKNFNYIDIFAGCGGLSLGLNKAGWKGLFAIEKSPHAFETLEYNLTERIRHFNWPKWLPKQAHDINEVIKNHTDELRKLRGKVTLVAGVPPCQGFSIAGQRNENDDRNKLIDSYVKFISLVKPKLIFFENVKGFTMEFKDNGKKGKKYSEIVIDKLQKEGYNVYGQLINFGDYGIPQKRTRFILIGIRNDIENSSIEKAKTFFELIEKNKFDFLDVKKINVHPTIEDALSDLLTGKKLVETPDRKGFKSSNYKSIHSNYQKLMRQDITDDIKLPNSHSFAKHSDKIIKRFAYIQSISSVCKNIPQRIKEELGITKQVLVPLKSDEQAPTMIHYREPRILTVREYARLQSFPDDFIFKGKYTTGGKLRKVEVPRYTQIGNAIPPLFGEQAGIVLKQLL